MKKKRLVIGIILLFIGSCIIPSTTSELTNDDVITLTKNIITVDDEPGDADFTSIKEAVNYASPGDTIEVYSGLYREDGIRIIKENIQLLGIDYELGEGGDTGQPCIKPDGDATVIVVEASYVIISNFNIEKLSSSTCIVLGADEPNQYQNNNTIMDCFLTNPYGYGIWVKEIGRDITIVNNTIRDCSTYGISAKSKDFTISRNDVSSCLVGIDISLCHEKNISYNTIGFCGTGISMYYGSRNMLYGNDIRSCNTGIRNTLGSNNVIIGNNIELCPIGYYNEHGGENHITQNNFEECMYFLPWFQLSFIEYFTRDTWDSNYFDTWKGTGPKRIPGLVIFGIPLGEFGIPIPVPWFVVDRNPANVPYYIHETSC